MGNGQQTPIGAIFALLAGIGLIVSIIIGIVADVELLGLLF